MVAENKDLIRYHDTKVNLTANLKEKMFGYANNFDQIIVKLAGGAIKAFSDDSQQVLRAVVQTIPAEKTFNVLTKLTGVALTGRVIAGGGGPNSGAAEQVDVLNKSVVILSPTVSNGFYDFINKADYQVLFIEKTANESINIGDAAGEAFYINASTSNDRGFVVIFDPVTGTWNGSRSPALED